MKKVILIVKITIIIHMKFYKDSKIEAIQNDSYLSELVVREQAVEMQPEMREFLGILG